MAQMGRVGPVNLADDGKEGGRVNLNLILTNLLYGLTLGSTLILISSGLSLTFGVMKVFSFAHGSLAMLGAYIGYSVVEMTGNFWLSFLIAPLAVGCLGLLMEYFTIRPLYGRDVLHIILLTVSLAMVFANMVIIVWGPDQCTVMLPDYFKGFVIIFGTPYPRFRLFVLFFSAAIALLIWFCITHTRWGIVVRAGMHSIETVSAFGINIQRVFTFVFAIGAALAAMAGVILGSMRVINSEMDLDILNSALIVVVIGGLGSFQGSVLGSLLIGVAEAFSAQFLPGVSKFTIWGIMVLVLLLKPEGLLKEGA
jgi:branched-subunit amino acid ABC-type transport system permease component